MLTITYPYMPPKELRGNSRTHWRAKVGVKQQFQEVTIWKLREQDPKPMDQINIHYTAYYCGRPIDHDNLIMGMKPAVDCLTLEGIIPDDSPDHIKNVSIEYHRVPHKKDVSLVMQITEHQCWENFPQGAGIDITKSKEK